jgi:hypothetical protein
MSDVLAWRSEVLYAWQPQSAASGCDLAIAAAGKIFGASWQLHRLGASRRLFDSHDP